MSRRVVFKGVGIAAALSALAALALGDGVLPRGTPKQRVPTVLNVRPSDVDRLVLMSGSSQAEFDHRNGRWESDSGSPQAAALLFSYEDDLFPMLAYRSVTANPFDPQYALVNPEIALRVRVHAGDEVMLHIGGATFSGAGFYARRADDPKQLYLIARAAMDHLRSLLAGQPVQSSAAGGEGIGGSGIETKHGNDQQPEEEMTVYVQQVLDSGGLCPRC